MAMMGWEDLPVTFEKTRLWEEGSLFMQKGRCWEVIVCCVCVDKVMCHLE